MTQLDHIGIAVDNLDEALKLWRDQLGLTFEGIEEVESEGVRVAMLKAGSTRIELLEPLGADTPVGKYLARRGPGIHHIALQTDALEDTMQRLRDAGRPPLHDEPQPGAGGAQITFVHPRDTGGVLLELTTGHSHSE